MESGTTEDVYKIAHRLMDSIQDDDKLNHLEDKDLDIIWDHIKEHYHLK